MFRCIINSMHVSVHHTVRLYNSWMNLMQVVAPFDHDIFVCKILSCLYLHQVTEFGSLMMQSKAIWKQEIMKNWPGAARNRTQVSGIPVWYAYPCTTTTISSMLTSTLPKSSVIFILCVLWKKNVFMALQLLRFHEAVIWLRKKIYILQLQGLPRLLAFTNVNIGTKWLSGISNVATKNFQTENLTI